MIYFLFLCQVSCRFPCLSCILIPGESKLGPNFQKFSLFEAVVLRIPLNVQIFYYFQKKETITCSSETFEKATFYANSSKMTSFHCTSRTKTRRPWPCARGVLIFWGNAYIPRQVTLTNWCVLGP